MYKYVISCNFCKTLMNKINKPKIENQIRPRLSICEQFTTVSACSAGRTYQTFLGALVPGAMEVPRTKDQQSLGWRGDVLQHTIDPS
jgi:hypothetical protein